MFSRKLWTIIALALVVKLTVFAAFAWHIGKWDFILGSTDTFAYRQLGENIFAGNGFSEDTAQPYTPSAGRPPLYPFILGLFGNNIAWFLILQLIVSAASIGLLYEIGKHIFDEKTAFWSAVITTFSPLLIFSGISVLTETWFVFWLLLSLYLLSRFFESQRNSFLVYSAIALGLGTLTRTVGSLFPLVVIIAILFLFDARWKKRLAAVGIFLVVFLAVLAPWVYRNYQVFGGVGLSSIPAYNLYFYNARVFFQEKNGLDNDVAKEIFRQRERDYRAGNPETNEILIQGFYKDEFFKVVKQDLPGYAKFHLINSAAVFFSSEFDGLLGAWGKQVKDVSVTSYLGEGLSGLTGLIQDNPGLAVYLVASLAFYGVIGIGFFLSITKKQKPRYFTWLILVILYFAVTTGAVAEPRFRVPAEPFIILLFVYSIGLITELGKEDNVDQLPENSL